MEVTRATLTKSGAHYNLRVLGLVRRRDGTEEEDIVERLYTMSLESCIRYMAHVKAQQELGDKDVTVTEYLKVYLRHHAEQTKELSAQEVEDEDS